MASAGRTATHPRFPVVDTTKQEMLCPSVVKGKIKAGSVVIKAMGSTAEAGVCLGGLQLWRQYSYRRVHDGTIEGWVLSKQPGQGGKDILLPREDKAYWEVLP